MFGFDGETEGLVSILQIIQANDELGKLTHKEVRAYARCLLNIVDEFKIYGSIKAEIKILLAALSSSGLPQYDRSFLASRILRLLEDQQLELSEQSAREDFF